MRMATWLTSGIILSVLFRIEYTAHTPIKDPQAISKIEKIFTEATGVKWKRR